MERKRLNLIVFAGVALIQLAVAGWAVARHELVLTRGEVYRFKTAPVDPVDAFRGRYVALAFDEQEAALDGRLELRRGQRLWVTVDEGPDGFARLGTSSRQRPEGAPAIRCRARTRAGAGSTQVAVALPFARYYMTETLAPAAEQAYRQAHAAGAREAFVTVRVWNGHAAIEELFIAGEPIREHLRSR